MTEKNEWQTIFRSGSTFFLGTGVVSLLAYGFHFFAGRFLSVADYGVLQALLSLQNMALVLVSMLGILLTRISAEYKRDEAREKTWQLQKMLNRWLWFPGSLLFILFFLSIPSLKNFFQINSSGAWVLWAGAFYLALLQSVRGSLLSGWHQFFQLNLGNMTGGLFKFILGVTFMFLGWGVLGGMAGILLGYLCQLGVNSYFVKKNFFDKENRKENFSEKLIFNWAKIKIFWQEAYPVFLGVLAMAIFSNGDILIAKHHFDQIQAGEYSALLVLAKMIFFAVGSFSGLVVPLITAEKEIFKKRRLFLRILLIDFLVAGAGVVFFYFFPAWVVHLLFGKEYLVIGSYLASFAFLALLLSTLNLFVQYFIALKKRKILLGIIFLAIGEIVFLWLGGKNVSSFFLIIFGFLLSANLVSGVYFLKSFLKRN